MIRIIDTNPHKSVVKEVICKNCGTTLEYTPSDVQRSCSIEYLDDRDYFNYSNFIKCPSCSHEIVVK